jgi:hypothetical protein
MRDSDTYQAILEEGRLDEVKRMIFRQGERRFGPPSDQAKEAVNTLNDLERLRRMQDRLLEPNLPGWPKLLNTP